MLVFFIAGAFLILKELIPLLLALSSGVIRTRGHNRKSVEKAGDPERFRSLCRQRFKAMGLGLLVIATGVLWYFLGIFALIPSFIIGAVMAANARKPKPIRRDDVDAAP